MATYWHDDVFCHPVRINRILRVISELKINK